MKTDTQLAHDVQTELDGDPSFDNRGVIIATHNGVVTLAGYISTHGQRAAVEGAVKRVAGVSAIANDIVVDAVAATRRSDSDLAAAAVEVLRAHPMISGNDIRPVVQDGWITLEGVASAWHEKNAAEQCLRDVSGIRGISNSIRLRFPVSASDVESEIKRSFQHHAKVDARKVHVEVDDSIVTLTGEVSSWSQLEEAEAVARTAPGVKHVNNLIRVRVDMQPMPE